MSHKIGKTLKNQLDKLRSQKKGLMSYLLNNGYSEANAEKTLKAYKKSLAKY